MMGCSPGSLFEASAIEVESDEFFRGWYTFWISELQTYNCVSCFHLQGFIGWPLVQGMKESNHRYAYDGDGNFPHSLLFGPGRWGFNPAGSFRCNHPDTLAGQLLNHRHHQEVMGLYSLRRSNHAGMTRESREQCFEHSVVHSHSSTSVVANLTLFRVVTFSFFRSLFLFFWPAFWQFWLCHHAIWGQKAWTQDGLPVICRVFWFLLDPALMVGPVADILAAFVCRKIRRVWRWSIYKFFPQKDGMFFLRPNKTMGFYVLENVTPVKFLGPSFWVSMFISGEGEKTPIVFLS